MRNSKITDNQRRILALIRQHDGISRTDISKVLGLSLPSISKHIERFIQVGHVFEDGFSLSSGGRRPIVLRYNYDYSISLNIIIEFKGVRAILTNLSGEHLSEVSYEFEDTSKSFIIEKLNDVINDERFSVADTVVVSIPGILDGTVIKKSNLYPDLEGKDLRELLSINKDIRVFAYNDVDCKVYGKYITEDSIYDSIYYISYEKKGIGCGLIINSQIHQGAHYYAGELGYLETKDSVSVHDLLFNKESCDFEARVETLSTMIMSVMFTLDPQIIYLAGNNEHMNKNLFEAIKQRLFEKVDLDFSVVHCEKNHEIQIKGMLEFAMHQIEMQL